jgi:hypothetical protein
VTGPEIRLTVNDAEVRVRAWARWRDAVTAYDPGAGAALATGRGWLHDEAGQPIDPDGHVVPESRIHFHETAGGESR